MFTHVCIFNVSGYTYYIHFVTTPFFCKYLKKSFDPQSGLKCLNMEANATVKLTPFGLLKGINKLKVTFMWLSYRDLKNTILFLADVRQ